MTLYAVGDIQGCAAAFDALLERLDLERGDDRLWLVGDLVNRGPDSLSVLRRLVELGDRVTAVLGNHDLHLLATAAGVRAYGGNDSFADVLEAPDRDALLDWLRRRPLIHHDAAGARVLVHAGIPPTWPLERALEHARELEARLAGPAWARALRDAYGPSPGELPARAGRRERLRFTVNGLTRMRYCDADGRLDFDCSGPPGSQPAGLMPWFDWPGRPARATHIVFGHWAALGLLRRADVTATDTGCVWGNALTAVPIDTPGEPVAISCAPASGTGHRAASRHHS